MNKLILFLTTLLPLCLIAQNEFINKGGDIYIEKGALIYVDGGFVNDNGATNGSIKNDGIIEVKGDFENKANATFTVYNDNTSKDRAVKFVGSGTQAIKGDMNNPGTASFYNLVIDKAVSTDVVEMQASASVEGSMVFGTTTTGTYNPSHPFTNNNQKGLVKTFDNSAEYLLSVVNGSTDAIAGYPAMAINGVPSTGYVITKGMRSSADGGLQRKVTAAVAYDYPIGTVEHGFNAVRMNFTAIPGGGGNVKGKFCDGTDNASGYVGMMSQSCVGCTANNPSPDNNGYNRYFSSNPCNANAPQWLTLQDGIKNHGYWSFASGANAMQYSYSIEVFPNSFTAEGNNGDSWRTLKYDGVYGMNPSASSTDWTPHVENVSNINDLLEYSRNTGTCYSGAGIPGGVYIGFGHYSMKMGHSGNALPVELMYVKAEPVNNASINVSWATALEINNRGFNVERSVDGINFTTIGFVAGHNNSTVENGYVYNDVNVEPNTVYYYKLNQVDNDGHNTDSYVVSADITGSDAAGVAISELMPNPAQDFSHLTVTASVSQDIRVELVNMVGQIVSSQTVSVNAGANTVSFDAQNIAAGNYSAVVLAGGKSFSKILVVSK